MNAQRGAFGKVGAATSLAVTGGAGLLLAEPGSAAWVAAAAVGALACLVHAHVMRHSRADKAERRVWRAFAGTAVAVAVGLVAEAAVRVAVRQGVVGTVWEGAGFSVAAVGFCLLLYVGTNYWNQFRADQSDEGDVLNGLSAVLVTVAGAGIALRVTDARMTDWAEPRMDLWLLHMVALEVLTGTIATVAFLGGRLRDPRVFVITGALGAAMLIQLGLGFVGEEVVGLSILALWLVIVSALGCCATMPSAPTKAPRQTSQSPVIGALFVLGVCVAVLVLNSVIGGDHLTTTLCAALAAVGSGIRLLQLVATQAELGRSKLEARTDELTGLANRRALKAPLRDLNDAGEDAALLIIDLDRFKEVNDHHGHTVGDDVLIVVARRLQAAVPGHALLCRLGGDEFAVLLPGGTPAEAVELAEHIVDVCAQRVPTSGGPVTLGASVGIATTDLDGHRDGELLRRADTAMYVAKRAGGGTSSYDGDADLRARTERERLEELRLLFRPNAATRRQREIAVHFQPQLATRSGAVVGAEALVRWRHPKHGLLPPGAFLDLVERHGLMADLTATVLRQACAEAVRWDELGHRLRVSVNLSTSSLSHPDLMPAVDGALREYGLDPSRLILEITETTLMAHPERALRVVSSIAQRGIGISIDDFGTGYSSLAYLHDLPVTELKLDRSFTARVASEERTARIVASTVDLSHGLGLRVVAEGVEDEGTLQVLTDLGCDETQGYLHARPMSADYFVNWLREHDPVAAPVNLKG